MTGGPEEPDSLQQWLTGEGISVLDALLAEAPDAIGVIDRDLKIRYVNWTGPTLTRQRVIGMNALDLVPPDDREATREAYQSVLRTGVPARYEMLYRDEQVVHIWDVRVGPIRREGEIVGLIAVSNDVTEQRREHADRDRFFSLSLDMLIVSSPDGLLRRVNPAFGQTLGHQVADLIATPFIDLAHPEDRARTEEVFRGVLQGNPVKEFENRYRRSDGEYRVFSWRATVDPVTGDIYAVARDVTTHRRTEDQLRQAQKMEAVGQLAGGVAHDFNNLLLAMLANAELAMTGVERDSKTIEYLREIERAGRRAAELTKRLLAFSRRQPFRPVPVDLNRLIRRLIKMLRRLLPESISIDLIPGHQLGAVSADPPQLEQVIVNLCVNARDAMETGGQLTIETENVLINGRYCEAHPWAKPGRYVLMSITDTGVGMTDEVRERAFEPFFTTKSAQHGTGLGLSTVYGIVQQHGGMVHVYSELGEGTTFKVYLPTDARLASEVGDKIERPPPQGQETILLAEDDARVRKVVIQILERAGYRVIAAGNGIEAIHLLREHQQSVRLVLLDVVMPELGGPETWERMTGMRDGLKVVFTSGYADDRYLARLPAEATVIGKPFRAEELLRRIRQRLDE